MKYSEFKAEVEKMGFVVVDGRVIASGFQPDRLNELEGSN